MITREELQIRKEAILALQTSKGLKLNGWANLKAIQAYELVSEGRIEDAEHCLDQATKECRARIRKAADNHLPHWQRALFNATKAKGNPLIHIGIEARMATVGVCLEMQSGVKTAVQAALMRQAHELKSKEYTLALKGQQIQVYKTHTVTHGSLP